MASSDKRLKNNINELLIDDSIYHIKNVKIITFDYNDDTRLENDKISIDTDTTPYKIQKKSIVTVMDKIYNYTIDVKNTWKLNCNYIFHPNKLYYFSSPENMKFFGKTDENGDCTILSVIKPEYHFEYLVVEYYETDDFVILYKNPTFLHTTNVTKYLLNKIESLEEKIKILENKV